MPLFELLNKNKNNNKPGTKNKLEKEISNEKELMSDRTENKIIKENYGEVGEVGDEDNDDENNVLNCPICFMNTTSGKKFQVAKCGHIICKDCCNSLFKSSNISCR